MGLRRGRHRPVLAAAGACLALLGWGLAGPLEAPPAQFRPGAEQRLSRLSHGLALSRSAHPFRAAAVRSAPRPGARAVGRLRMRTEDGFAEVYLLIALWRAADGKEWVRIRLPGRPNGRTGWVPRNALGAFRATRAALLIDRERLRATFMRAGRPRWHAPVGIGAPGTPTPAGRFWVREQFPVAPGSLYGAYAFGTSAYSRLSEWPRGGVVGIHGTDAPWLIPGRPSHGCVRMRNRDVLRLAGRLPNGAPVLIR